MDPFFFSAASPSSYLDGLQFWDLSMDPSFDLLEAATGSFLPPPSPISRRSGFTRFVGSSTSSPLRNSQPQPRKEQNIHQRIIKLMRSMQEGNQQKKSGEESRGSGGGGREGSRGFRHMMRERQRRERLSQSYADLYTMLSPRTKADKNSIVQAAAAMVREMKGVKEGLQKRNEELMRKAASEPDPEWATTSSYQMMDSGNGVITLRAENPASTIDSIIAALRCLESMHVKARTIRSELAGHSGGWMTTFMTVETNKGDEEVHVMKRILGVEGWSLRTT